jgi:hypothetical protein
MNYINARILTNAQASLLVIAHSGLAGNDNHWREAHNAAVRNPRGIEVALMYMYAGLFEYAREIERELGYPVGQDGYAADEFKAMAKAFSALLNMPTGKRLDCGTLDGAVRRLCADNGVELGS